MFCEPLQSSQLIYNCWCIFDGLFRIRKRLFNAKKIKKSILDLSVELDGIILDFYQHHFRFGPKFPDTTLPLLISKSIIIPLKPNDQYYLNDINNKLRPSLNGFVMDFLLEMSNCSNNKFFQINHAPFLSALGRAKCFVMINTENFLRYRDFCKIDLFSEQIMYNKYENSEFYFERDDGEEEEINDDDSKKKRISVIVDEIPRFNEMVSPKKRKKSAHIFIPKKIISDKPSKNSESESEKSISDKPSENSESESEKSISDKPSEISKSESVKSISDHEEENARLRDELEEKNKKISSFEEILSLTLSRPNKNAKSDENHYIDSEEESNFHTHPVKIDEGATSITYKVIDKRTKTPYCKKVLKYRKGQTTIKDAQNAIKEFEILHKISHPCICKVFGINMLEKVDINKEEEDYNNNDDDDDETIKGKEITTIALFLEFIDYSLADVLKMKISNTTKVRIIIDIVHAMKFIHEKGLIHRDLKIENIMLNSFFETKVVDFGLASISEFVIDGFSQKNESLTKGIGTFAYMSPEMANEEHYDNKTDVYSFGVLLHAIFTGKPVKQTIKEKVNGVAIKLPRPSTSISKFCIKLIEQCLAHSPSKRPSFEEILNQIRENSYELAPGVDPLILSKRDKELDFIENYK